ncbi:sulfatase [uncultured Draconibacterium sp.]|uniref:sulfatase family protein n=1 Tax=uncultured Draconibacterium sp. TaxID=1573823 RepID=UPI0025DFE43C|nr:sulfatase [uncultured Draconibacterium sp.]
MQYLKLTLVTLLFTISFLSCSQKHTRQEQPNVIFIFPDQFRSYSLGFWSQGDNAKHLQGQPDPVSTPNLDKLANQGVVFSRAVSNFPLCSPYRGMLLSGLYPDLNGLTSNCRADREVQLRTDAVCITDVFAEAGYNVSYFGKCHWQKTEPLFDKDGNYVGSLEEPGGHLLNRYDTYVPPGPDRHGIDYFFQALKDEHFNPRVFSNDPGAIEGKKDGELYMPKRFSAEIESEKIVEYLENNRKQRDPDKPFFMIWSLNPPHNPWTEESTYMQFYNQYTNNGVVELGELLTHKNADHEAGDYAAYYFANVSAVDHFIGMVLNKLEELNLHKNTIICFSSDHGEMLGSHGHQGKPYPETEAFNIPFIVKWGDKLEHRVEDLILSVPDVMPTILGMVGLEEKIPSEVQGANYADAISKPGSQKKPTAALYIDYKSRGVYTGNQTLVVLLNEDGQTEVYGYDNIKDPNQLNRIPFTNVKNGPELKTELEHLLKSTNDKWYTENICSDFLNYNE